MDKMWKRKCGHPWSGPRIAIPKSISAASKNTDIQWCEYRNGSDTWAKKIIGKADLCSNTDRENFIEAGSNPCGRKIAPDLRR